MTRSSFGFDLFICLFGCISVHIFSSVSITVELLCLNLQVLLETELSHLFSLV